MILGVSQYITEVEVQFAFPWNQFGEGRAPRNGHSKLTDLGSSAHQPL